jgi:hypothetical protein
MEVLAYHAIGGDAWSATGDPTRAERVGRFTATGATGASAADGILTLHTASQR